MTPRKRFWTTWAGRQLLVCAAGLAVSLLPTWGRTQSFWGVQLVDDSDSGVVVVGDVDPASPAADAGLRPDDEVTTFNGRPLDAASLQGALEDMRPGQRLPLTVQRNNREQTLYAVGQPESALLLWHWQFATALTFLALGAVLIATQPLEPAPPWRPLAVGVVGFVLAAAVPALGPAASWEVLWRPPDALAVAGPDGPPLPLEAAAALVGAALVLTASFEIRNIIIARRTPVGPPADAADKFTPTPAPPAPPAPGLKAAERWPGR
jgi:hypothetical protein